MHKSILVIDKLTFQLSCDYKFSRNHIQDTYIEIRPGCYLLTARISLIFISFLPSSRYEHIWLVEIDKNPFANLLTSKGSLQPKLELLNSTLYSNFSWSNCIKLFENVGLRVDYISELDIAYDTTEPVRNIYGSLWRSSNLYADAENIFHKSVNKVKARIDASTYYVGRISSGKEIVIYDKTSELYRRNKHYIEQLYSENDFAGNVHRIELKARRKWLKRFDLNWNELNDQTIKQVFVEGVGSNLSFYNIQSKHYDSNRNIKYGNIISLIDTALLTTQKIKKVDKIKYQNESEYSNRITFKTLLYDWIESKNNQDRLSIIRFIEKHPSPTSVSWIQLAHQYAMGHKYKSLSKAEIFQILNDLFVREITNNNPDLPYVKIQ